MADARRPNRLIDATSPYLRQHAYNPVDWFPWGPEALDQARREDKPIFLSIGYSTCHWCHVMAHESFENEAIAALLNQYFVAIKVDREERPDLDETYMNAVQTLTGRGGWPLSVFLSPDLKPFYGGTYFPPEDRGGLPGFGRILTALGQTYQQNREQIAEISRRLLERLEMYAAVPAAAGEPAREDLKEGAQRLLQDFDADHGGLGGAPKFPRSLELGFLLHHYRFSGEREVLEKLAFTLENMARGGIYDQLGGGFHRYAVDAAWVVPHFEKMLYDNALLPPLYLALHLLTGREFFRRVARETLDFVLRDMAAPEGGFYSGWDADSEGVEGKFYVWTQTEVEQVVGAEDAPLAAAALGVTAEGNFEGQNILTRPLELAELAARFSLTPEQAAPRLNQAMDRLRRARQSRIHPHRDEKLIVSWNGLMISVLAQGAQVLGEKRYVEAAARSARFLLQELLRDGRLHRIFSRGVASVSAFSEDYSVLANALLDLYETDFDPEWLGEARGLLEALDELFLDEDGTYFYVGRDQEATLVRSKSLFDQTIPSGNSMAARVAWRLYRLTGEARFRDRAQGILRRFWGAARQNPWGFAHLLTVAELQLAPPLDLTLVGDPAAAGMAEFLRVIHREFLPERRLVLKDPAAGAALEALLPWTVAYSLPAGEAGPLAYLCHDFACHPPVAAPEDLASKLAQLKP